MAIIQTIRDRGAAIVIAVIALSLIGFLLMDARSGSAKLFGSGNTTTVGKVNGNPVELDEFNEREKQMEQQYGNSAAQMRYQIRQNTWDQIVSERVLNSEFEKLGLSFTAKEMSSIMFSEDAPPQLKQAFTNEQTKQYDVEKAKQWWAEVRKSKNEEQRAAVNSEIVDPLRLNSLYGKYTSMISASVYVPSWMAEQETKENNSFANISYVAIPYSEVSDSAVVVSDKDIENYLEAHKAKYKQEGGRMLSYVVFNAAPSAKDSAKTFQDLEAMKQSFAADTNTKAFIARNSAINFSNAYEPKSKLPAVVKDTLAGVPNGTVFGPYLDGKNYVVAKKLDTKILPDSIKCRHILLGTANPQTGAELMKDSVAHAKADSVEMAIKTGANFDSLEAKYSTDQVAHKDKGVMTFDLSTIQSENFAKEFGEFLLNEKGETKKVIKTQFGWHYIEILEKKNPQPAYKIAYLGKEIIPSDETINNANAAATKLSGQARNEMDFDKYVSENGLNKVTPPNVIKENDYQVGALSDARSLVLWAFKADEGAVSEPYSMGSQYVVACMTRKVKEGIPDAKTARPQVESLVRNHKKADEIKKKLGTPATLEAAAGAYNKQVLSTGADSTLTFRAAIINGVGNEPMVAGASFNPDYQTKVSPAIEGNTGVFVIKVNSVSPKAVEDASAANQRLQAKKTQMAQVAAGQSFNSLKKTADIKDNRSKFF